MTNAGTSLAIWQRQPSSARLRLPPEHRQVVGLQHLARAEGHVDAAGEAGIEAPHGAHDVDPLESLRSVLLGDRGVLHGVLVGAGGAVGVADPAVPGRRRVGMVVGDLAVADDEVVGEHAADGFVEAAGDGLARDGELGPGAGAPRAELR